MKTTTVQYGSIGQIPLEGTFIKAEQNRKEKTIIYIHGGGLVYGSRDDLPDVYIQKLVNAGYDFFSIDYPLAPESKLDDIVNSIQKALQWLNAHASSILELSTTDYILFGRSSGAYLSLLMNKQALFKRPLAIICLYGYYSLMDGRLKGPNRYYAKFPKMKYNDLLKLLEDKPIVNGPLEKRYSIYLYYRQTGKWVYQLIKEQESLSTYSLTEEDLKELPPTFLSASTDDQDVPYHFTETLAQSIPKNELFTVNGLEHDFDRHVNLVESETLYYKIINWLDTID